MPMSDYMRGLRERVGTRLLLVPGVAAVIHDADGRVLVLQTTSGHWSLPAGAIDPGETARDAVVRETREETGLEVVPTRLLDVVGGRAFRIRYGNGDEVEGTIAVFACGVVGGELRCDGVETVAWRWVPPGEVPALLPLPYPAPLFSAT